MGWKLGCRSWHRFEWRILLASRTRIIAPRIVPVSARTCKIAGVREKGRVMRAQQSLGNRQTESAHVCTEASIRRDTCLVRRPLPFACNTCNTRTAGTRALTRELAPFRVSAARTEADEPIETRSGYSLHFSRAPTGSRLSTAFAACVGRAIRLCAETHSCA
jgi:hypothetical protein